MISIALLSRSHNHCKLAKLLTIYFKSCGLAAKAFDTLHALGITMSQKWAYSGIEALSKTKQLALLEDIKRYPWFGAHGNLNLPFRAYEQRLHNQRHFDSGTAATVFIIKDPLAVPPDNSALRKQIALGAKDPITFKDILKLEMDASPRINARAISRVLSFLTGTPSFEFETYPHKDHPVFASVTPVNELPIGSEHTASQYMLQTVHMEGASYEGTDRVLKEWWRQLKLDSPEEQKKLGKE